MTAWQLLKKLLTRKGKGLIALLVLFNVLMAVVAVASGLGGLLAAPVIVVDAVAIRLLAAGDRSPR